MPSRLSLDRIAAAARVIDPVFLHTPQFVCEPLSKELGVRVVLKVETINPVRSFKGRGAEFFVSQLHSADPLLCASAGNFGMAMAFACRRRGIPLTVYAGVNANELKLERMRSFGAAVVLHGEDFDAAKLESKRVAAETGARTVEDGLEPPIAEGAGTIGLELLDTEPFDTALIPVGNGALIGGIGCVLKGRRPGTRIIAVQSSGAPAMVESWRARRPVSHDRIDTIADGIGVRTPIPEAVEDMLEVVDDAVLVDDESLRRAMRLLHQHTGLVVEPSGAAAIAAVLEHREVFTGQTVAAIVCGGNLTPEQMYRWL